MTTSDHIRVPKPSRHPRLPSDFAEPPALPARQSQTPQPGRVLLINPFYRKDPNGSLAKHVLTPSLALSSLAAATQPPFEPHFWDENLLQGPPPIKPFPEIVGITVHLSFAARAYALAEFYRRCGAKVVLGGLHVTACPDEAQPHADAIVLGDGVGIWPQVLRDLRNDRHQPRYEGSFRSPHYSLAPTPRRDILPARSFLTTSSLIATRGCHNRCSFCYLAFGGLDMPYQKREIHQVVDEIQTTGLPYSVFIDNNLGSNPAYLKRLCRALRPLNHIWSAAVSLDVSEDPELVREMALAGCTGVFIGFETLDARNLHSANKRSPSPDEFGRRVRLFHDNGIQVNGSFVLGFDHDGPEVFEKLVDWVERQHLACATLQILTPYPGTPLFTKLEAEGRILHRDWSLYDTSHAVFQPSNMSPEELEAGYAWCYERLFSWPSIWKRRPEDRWSIPSYLAVTSLYKHCNWLWAFLIRHRLVAAAWRPLIHLARLRQLNLRRSLQRSCAHNPRSAEQMPQGSGVPLPPHLTDPVSIRKRPVPPSRH